MEGWWLRARPYLLLSLAWAIFSGAVVLTMRRPLGAPVELIPPPTPLPTPTPAPIRVYVSGAVQHPDVYLLPTAAIVRDAITAAGGATEEGDLAAINLALPLADGAHVHVPRAGEVAAAPPISGGAGLTASAGGGTRVNINTATIEELDKLPGIGPEKAQRIIEGRPYAAPEDLKKVAGIGEATFAKLKDLISVR